MNAPRKKPRLQTTDSNFVTDSIFTFRFQKPDEERLDHFLVESLPDYSRARLQGLVKDGFVLGGWRAR